MTRGAWVSALGSCVGSLDTSSSFHLCHNEKWRTRKGDVGLPRCGREEKERSRNRCPIFAERIRCPAKSLPSHLARSSGLSSLSFFFQLAGLVSAPARYRCERMSKLDSERGAFEASHREERSKGSIDSSGFVVRSESSPTQEPTLQLPPASRSIFFSPARGRRADSLGTGDGALLLRRRGRRIGPVATRALAPYPAWRRRRRMRALLRSAARLCLALL
jgi:hypothetical protein